MSPGSGIWMTIPYIAKMMITPGKDTGQRAQGPSTPGKAIIHCEGQNEPDYLKAGDEDAIVAGENSPHIR